MKFNDNIQAIEEGLWDRTKARVAGVGGAVKGLGQRVAGGVKGAVAGATGDIAGAQAAAQQGKAGKAAGPVAKVNSYRNTAQTKIKKLTDEILNDLSKLGIDIKANQNIANGFIGNLNKGFDTLVNQLQGSAAPGAGAPPSTPASAPTASTPPKSPAPATPPAPAPTASPASPTPAAAATSSSETPSTDKKAADSGTPGITYYDPKETNPPVRFSPPKDTASAAAPAATPGASATPSTPPSTAAPSSPAPMDDKSIIDDLNKNKEQLMGNDGLIGKAKYVAGQRGIGGSGKGGVILLRSGPSGDEGVEQAKAELAKKYNVSPEKLVELLGQVFTESKKHKKHISSFIDLYKKI